MRNLASSDKHVCGLCSGRHASLFYRHSAPPIAGRPYYKCADCGLIQVAKDDRLTKADEKAVYDLHENDPDDLRYRKFLSQLTTPLLTLLSKHKLTSVEQPAQGLDFGSGPGPTLSGMLRDQGVGCADYDIFYAPEPQRLREQYDFITSTEVFEHLADPHEILDILVACLKPKGILAIMMQRPDEQDNFANWRYILDPTHISFYTNQSLNYISNRWSLKECYRDRNVLIWQAAGSTQA